MVGGKKRVKRGYREACFPKICGVVFDGEPAWLWSIRMGDFEQILITQPTEEALRKNHAATWSLIHHKTRIIHESDVGSKRLADLWLVSGSWDFVTEQHPWTMRQQRNGDEEPGKAVIWLHPSFRRKPSVPEALDAECCWTWLAHSQVGGATTVRGLFGVTKGMQPISSDPDPICRTIDHVLKYAIRPTPCPPEFGDPHYLVTGRISPHLLEQPVLYPTHFSRTGWGYRKLTPAELAHAYDLPTFIPWESRFKSTIVPLQLLRVVIDQVLDSASDEGRRDRPTQRPRLHGPSPAVAQAAPCAPDREFLPGLQCWLPGSWADAKIAARAVKSDNASVDFSPWHRRISLVLPCDSTTIIRFEALALKWWRRRLARSFRLYLGRTYGSEWQRLVWTAERCSHNRVCESGVVPPHAKRARLQGGHSDRGVPSGAPERRTGRLTEARLMELVKDVQAGRAVLAQLLQCSWWEWTHGSSLCFWRWNGDEQIRAARDGMKIFVKQPLPQGRKSKQLTLPSAQRDLVAEKLDGMLRRSYLDSGFVSNSLHFFAVPKGDADIRVVFDGTSSGLNETLWAPNFYLPSARAASLNLSFSTWMSDMDFGEMFHNFFMDPSIRKCAGVKITPIVTRLKNIPLEDGQTSKPEFLRWSRLFMGMKPSPYNAVRYYYWGEEFARGNPATLNNPMGFDRIRLNLPGSTTYDPGLPKVIKWNDKANAVAGDVITFVDDVRITGYSKANCHGVRRQFASRIQFLGMQDAPRKFRPPSQIQAGAWTGTIFRVGPDTISKAVSVDKWAKGKAILSLLKASCEASSGRPNLDRKALERDTGFLNHLSMTYENFNPYLKGFYLTLNSWRTQRDADDWKVPDKRWKQWLMEQHLKGELTDEELDAAIENPGDKDAPPAEVTASTRFVDDVGALYKLFLSTDAPPEVRLRSKNIVTVVYGFGDASGSGLGSTFTCGAGFTFRIGVWGSLEKPESSNWKEFTNVVEALEDEAKAGNLDNSEVFMFTDNSTVEACAKKGSSSSRKLLDLIVRLQTLTTSLGVQIHIFHVAGTRMIAQGTDGVSRGCLGQGVMAGDVMSAHIPIYLSAIDRVPSGLLEWIKEWSGGDSTLLTEMGWFTTGHDIDCWDSGGEDGFERPVLIEGRTYIWAPPPIAADVALGELRKARIKRQTSAHVVVVPRLCTTLWLRQLCKAADIVFEVPVGFSTIWPHDMHEPLLIGVLFPFLRSKPWQLRNTPKMFAVGRDLRGLFKDSPMDTGDFLCKFWEFCFGLQRLPENVVRKMLYFE